jgi:hypothetical protein
MSRIALPLLAISLVGCSQIPSGEPMPIPPPRADVVTACGAEKVASFIGQKRNAVTVAEISRLSSAKAIRWISPGMAVTMDYRDDRLNVHLDDKGVIAMVNCG